MVFCSSPYGTLYTIYSGRVYLCAPTKDMITGVPQASDSNPTFDPNASMKFPIERVKSPSE